MIQNTPVRLPQAAPVRKAVAQAQAVPAKPVSAAKPAVAPQAAPMNPAVRQLAVIGGGLAGTAVIGVGGGWAAYMAGAALGLGEAYLPLALAGFALWAAVGAATGAWATNKVLPK